MVFIIKKTLWSDVFPIVLFWTITAEIEKLNNFLHLFTELTSMQTLEFIWLIIQPKNYFNINTPINTPKVQSVYDYIAFSPQLILIQNEIYRDNNAFLLKDEYASIKTDIATFFEYNEYYITSSRMIILITQLLQLSSSEIVEELFYHYNDIWKNWTNWQQCYYSCPRYIAVIPTIVSVEEQHILRVTLYEDDDRKTRDMLFMHDMLVQEIVNCRSDNISKLEHNIELHLSNLQKVLKEHLL